MLLEGHGHGRSSHGGSPIVPSSLRALAEARAVDPPSSPPRGTSASGSGQDNLHSAAGQTRDPDKLELPVTSSPEVRGGSSPASRLQAKVLMMEPSKQAEFLLFQSRVAKLSGKVTAEDPDYL